MPKIWVRIIAILEVVGGIFGIVFVAKQTADNAIDSLNLVLALISVAIYVFSFIAGIALWREQPFGRIASIVVQAIQLPKYASQLLVFMFSFGFDTYVYGALANNASPILGFELKFLAFSQLSVNVADVPAGFGVSISAAIFLAMLFKYKPHVDTSVDEQSSLPPAPNN